MIGRCIGGLLVALGLVCQPAQAGDRKSTGRVQETARAILVSPGATTTEMAYERRSALTVGVFETGYAVSATRGVERERASVREHQPLTLFHFNSKFGDVAVQPVIGKVNGAQFSLGF